MVPNQVFRTARKNAARRGINFTLSGADCRSLVERAGGRCEVTGIAFDSRPAVEKWARRPWAPSLDRIDSCKGYDLWNCRLVCVAVNLALHSFGEDVLRAIARGLLGFADAQGFADLTKRAAGVRIVRGKNRPSFNARIKTGGRYRDLGSFDTMEAAARAFSNARFAFRTALGKST